MKDKLDIEKLFQDKFKNFEGDVNSSLWNNISQGIASNPIAGVGMGLGFKALVLSTSVVAIGLTTYLVGGFNAATPIIEEHQVKLNNEVVVTVTEDETIKHETFIIAEDNDPVISENEEEIIKSLSNQAEVYKTESENIEIEGELSDITLSNNESAVIANEVIDNNSVSSNESIENADESERSNENVLSEQKPNIVFPSGNLSFKTSENIYSYNFKANAKNQTKVEWNFGDGQLSKELNPNHVYASAGEYKVKLTLISKDSEIYEESKTINIKTSSSIDNIPNVITPNGDRINDQFVIKMTDIDIFNITINDQFGNKIFESNDQNFTWDGTDMSGNIVEKAVYTYYIFATGQDGTVLKIPGQLYVR